VFGDAVFPFFGQPLSMTETLAPIGQMSQVIQYGVQTIVPPDSPDLPVIPKLLIPGKDNDPAAPELINSSNDGRSSFGVVGFPDNCEIRIRSLNIYCTY
jgi:hypothetical protein